MYFVPRTHMDKVDVFEDFIGLLGGLNRRETPLMVNSFFIIDDEKQRSKMTEEFYAAVKKEIATYQERADYLIKSGSQSPAVMERWVLKIQALEEKKKHYEGGGKIEASSQVGVGTTFVITLSALPAS